MNGQTNIIKYKRPVFFSYSSHLGAKSLAIRMVRLQNMIYGLYPEESYAI